MKFLSGCVVLKAPPSYYLGLQLSLSLAASLASDHHSTCFGWGPTGRDGEALCHDFTQADFKTGRNACMHYVVWSLVQVIWQRKTDVTFVANPEG